MWNKIKAILLRSEFYRNILTLVSGTAIAQVIPILISPILSRIYSPDEFGAFSFYLTIASLLSILATGRFEQAIPLPKHDVDGFFLLVLSFLQNILFSFVLLIILFLFKDTILIYIDNDLLKNYIFFLPIVVFLLGSFQSLNYWHNRNKKFKIIAIGKVVRTSVIAIGKLLFSSLSVAGLILGDFLGRVLSVLYMTFFLRKGIINLKDVKIKNIVYIFRTYKNFIKYSMPNAFFNSTSNSLPILLITNYYGTKNTGLYSWSMMIIQTPMGMITSSVFQVFFQKISVAFNENKDLQKIVRKTYMQLAYIGFFPYLFVFFFAPSIFGFLFGDEWTEAGIYTRYLVPWLFLVFLNSPLTSIIMVLNKQKEFFIYEVVMVASRFAALFLGYWLFDSIHFSLGLYSFVGVVFNLFLMRFILVISKNNNENSVYG